MEIINVQGGTFDKVEMVTTTYSISDIYSQIHTLTERMAQLIANGQTNIKGTIAPIQAEIDQLTALLALASDAGADTTPPTDLPDVTDIVASLDTISANAIAVASPPVVQSEDEEVQE